MCRRAGEQLKVGGGGWKGTVNDEERDTGIQLVDEQCKRHTEVRVKHEQAHKIEISKTCSQGLHISKAHFLSK